jgi:chemotaxis protein histidine kinase CheA
MACGCQYNFDGTEAIRLLGLENIKVSRQKAIVEKRAKEVKTRAAFPLPYNGEFNEVNCYALRQNNGLYTQCQSSRKGENDFCKACQMLADKNGGIPEYGTIKQRQAVGIFEYVDPKGRKPVSYTKVMKKYKVSEEQVLAEAGKLNMEINVEHFVAPEAESKRGRPSVKKEKVSEPKGPKGRPKKTKKVLEIAGDDNEDLFAAMVADAVSEASDNEEEKVSKKKASEESKAAKEAQRLHEKAEKEAKLAVEKAEKAAKKAAEEEEKAAKKAALEAKKAALEEEKAAKKAALEAKKAANESKKSKKPTAAASASEEEEGIRVDTKKVDGKKYLVSSTGIVYDYNQWKHHQEQVVIGKWNHVDEKIEFTEESDSEDEESADEYEA